MWYNKSVSTEYPQKIVTKTGYTWHADCHNVFHLSKNGLTGCIGNFREGGACEPKSLQQVKDGDFIGWGGNSLFGYLPNEIVENLKADIMAMAETFEVES